MKRFLIFSELLFIVFIYACSSSVNADERDNADIGDFTLVSGEVIKDCRIGYRTMGQMNRDKSNIILMLTWFTGTTQELIDMGYIGAGKMLDTSKYYVIAVDAIGNGVSSSPSNSSTQPGVLFPAFTVKDMVNSQYILLTKFLGISHVYAIAGISMGGMQTFQWSVSYPTFMDRIVSISGSPWLSSYDLLAWSSELAAMGAAKKGGLGNDDIMKAITPIHQILVWSPSFRDANTKPEDTPAFIQASEQALCKYNAVNWEWQIKAIMDQNILKSFGGSKEHAAAAVKAKALVVTSLQDYAVYPKSSLDFAALIKAQTSKLTGDCGHFSFICEQNTLAATVNEFLAGS